MREALERALAGPALALIPDPQLSSGGASNAVGDSDLSVCRFTAGVEVLRRAAERAPSTAAAAAGHPAPELLMSAAAGPEGRYTPQQPLETIGSEAAAALAMLSAALAIGVAPSSLGAQSISYGEGGGTGGTTSSNGRSLQRRFNAWAAAAFPTGSSGRSSGVRFWAQMEDLMVPHLPTPGAPLPPTAASGPLAPPASTPSHSTALEPYHVPGLTNPQPASTSFSYFMAPTPSPALAAEEQVLWRGSSLSGSHTSGLPNGRFGKQGQDLRPGDVRDAPAATYGGGVMVTPLPVSRGARGPMLGAGGTISATEHGALRGVMDPAAAAAVVTGGLRSFSVGIASPTSGTGAVEARDSTANAAAGSGERLTERAMSVLSQLQSLIGS